MSKIFNKRIIRVILISLTCFAVILLIKGTKFLIQVQTAPHDVLNEHVEFSSQNSPQNIEDDAVGGEFFAGDVIITDDTMKQSKHRDNEDMNETSKDSTSNRHRNDSEKEVDTHSDGRNEDDDNQKKPKLYHDNVGVPTTDSRVPKEKNEGDQAHMQVPHKDPIKDKIQSKDSLKQDQNKQDDRLQVSQTDEKENVKSNDSKMNSKETNDSTEGSIESKNESSRDDNESKSKSTKTEYNSKVLQDAVTFISTKYSRKDSLIPKIIHQQYSAEKNIPLKLKPNVDSFRASGSAIEYFFWGDDDLNEFVSRFYPNLYKTYSTLPMIILKADLARYLLLNTFGGVYSDVDTKLIRPIGDWADNNDSKVGLMVGIEVDTTRADWKEWYPRSLGFCQWTMASSPGHPVLAKVIYNVIENIQNAKNEIKKEDVVILTGPGVWTDAIMEYLSLQGVEEIQLRNLKEPLLKGDVYVLPITAFSPGVGHMGSQDITDKEARVQHLFEGSWKESK